MRAAQQVIKFFALALALIITVSIFGAVIGGVFWVGTLVGSGVTDGNWGNEPGVWTEEVVESREIAELDVNVKATRLEIRRTTEGEPVKVETNNEYVSTWTNGKRLDVVEKSHGFFGWGGTGDVVVYVRDDVKFDKVKMEVGAGTLIVESLETKELDLDLGAGKAQIDNLKVTERAEIDGGAGKTAVSGELKNARIELGAGKADVMARLLGDSKVKAGVGKLDLVLIGQESDYRITVDKGIGSVNLDGRSLGDGARWGEGENRVDLEAGVGAVDIRLRGE